MNSRKYTIASCRNSADKSSTRNENLYSSSTFVDNNTYCLCSGPETSAETRGLPKARVSEYSLAKKLAKPHVLKKKARAIPVCTGENNEANAYELKKDITNRIRFFPILFPSATHHQTRPPSPARWSSSGHRWT